jgi:drug/metabolite transporter (DMT)-like permease
MIAKLRNSAWNSAWTLLSLSNLLWAGNIVIGRAVAGTVPPIALAYWRWTGAFLVAIGFAWPHLKRDLPTLVRHTPMMLVLSATGIASYNTMAYIGLNSTTALHVLLLQSALPLIVIVWALVLLGERPTLAQSAGVLVSLAGVAAIAGRGSIETLMRLELNAGDAWVLAGLAIYGIYCTVLPRRPPVHPLSFLVAAMGIGSCMMLPFYLAERASGATIHGSLEAYAAMAYIAVLPSFVAYLFFNRGIELIGGTRAGQSSHLTPLFGSLLAVLFLGEHFYVYDAIGIVLIGAGILLASMRAASRPGRAAAPAKPAPTSRHENYTSVQ